MIAFKKLLLVSALVCFNHILFSQIKIKSPLNRAVYQRNVFGYSTITIAGSYERQVDKIEAKFTPVEAGQGEATDWTTIKNLPLNGNFSVSVQVRQGWYRLEVRGSLNGQLIGDIASVDRVGVGEVFIIAGQSNAEGVLGPQALGASNDRVNCLATNNDRTFGGTDYINLSPFSKLDKDSRIAPRGVSAWCWGRLGDLIVNRLNVPVMFFNAAFEGTTVNAWATTANGGLATNPYIGGVYQNRMPYQNMADVLKYYVPLLGVRAVLWCQGEADNRTAITNSFISAVTYKSLLQTVINRTRIDTGKEIAWMVSLTSALVRCPTGCVVGPFAPSDENVLEGQRSTIRETSKVFQGPFTDPIQNPGRQDGVHFNGELPKLAEEWSNAMNDNFFQNATPFIPTPVPDIAFNCGDNRVDVTLPDGYNNYEWSDNSLNFNNGRFSSQRRVTLDVAGGRQYFARFRDGNGNVIQVPAISFAGSNIPVSSVTATGATDFCEGNRAILKANDAVIYEWNNGSRSQEITVTTSGSYSVRTISQFGCQTNFSNPTIITAKPGPPKPTISANGNTIFCADTNVVLQSSNQDAVNYLWNNGTNSRTLKVNATGSYTVKTVNSQGCLSNESDEIKITVNPLPATPSIVPNGATTFCADTSVVLRSSNQDAVSYRWNTGSTTRDVTIRTAGDYSVRTVDRNGCISKSSAATRIRVNTLPPAPSISSTRDTVFCQGDGTILQMALTNGGFPTWLATQDGVVNRFTFSNLNVNRTGSYRGFQTDVNGCKSGLSRAIFVSVKPLPPKVETIQRLSPYTIGIEKPQANVYEWQYNGTNRPDLTASIVRINEAGKYRVTAKNVYKTLSYGEKVCASEPSSEFSFELYDDNGMSIFPNPSKGVFYIDSKIDWRNSTLEVYTLLGALVKKASVPLFDDVKKIDLSDLPEGEYMLRIRSDNFYTISKRVMINR